MAVEPDLCLAADLGDQRLHPGLRLAEDQRAGRVDHVHALRARVNHDPGLPGQLSGPDPVAEHQEPDGLHAEVAGGGEMLHGDVGLGAVRGDPGHRRPGVPGMPQVVGRAEAGQQQHRDPRAARLLHRRGDQAELVLGREAVVERRAAEPVAVRDLDDLHVRLVQRVHHRADLPLGELVRERVRPVAQRRVGQPDPLRAAAPGARFQAAGHGALTGRPAASSSPTRAAAAVMMSRLPA